MHNSTELFKNIKLLIFDLQGVLVSSSSKFDNTELNQLNKIMTIFCDFAKDNNLLVAIITGIGDVNLRKKIDSNSPCETLFASIDKVAKADTLVEKYKIPYKNIFYIGDDLLDIPLLKKVALSATPQQARREVKKVVNFICPGKTGTERLEFIINSITNLNSQ